MPPLVDSLYCSLHMLKLLTGIRVIDLTRILAGPYATMILGDLGADIIKIERPFVGDETRRLGPPFLGPESIYFLSINRNKKSVAIDISNHKGQRIIRELAMKAHVIVENFVPGKLKQFGLDYHSMADVNPRLIYCSLSGFGQSGPYTTRPGFDLIAQGVGGMLNITGPEGGEPCRSGVALIDMITGLYANIAILSALREIELNNANGKWIDCNLLSSQLAVLSTVAANYLNTGEVGKKFGSGHPSIVPYQAFKTADGYYVMAAISDDNFIELCNVLDLEYVKKSAKFSSNKDRVLNRLELIPLIENKMISKSSREWGLELRGVTFAHGPVNDFEAVFSDAHILQMNLLKSFTHATAGELKMVGSPIRLYDSEKQEFTDTQGSNSAAIPPPILGEHTREVLTSVLDYTQSHVDDLIKEKVIQ